MMTTTMMNILKKWLLSLLGRQPEPAPQPAPRSDEEKPAAARQRAKSGGSEKQAIADGVEQFFKDRYELRFNILKRTEEFRPRLPENAAGFAEDAVGFAEDAAAGRREWQQLTDRELRRMAFEQMKEVGVAWSIDVALYVRSAAVPRFDPIADYLSRTAPWDGVTDHIGALARRVPTDFADWPRYFRRWLLGMVAQWQQRSPDYGNALVPMLIGSQGTHKSTFCKLLLPRELREYYIDDIKLDSSEQVERMLARMLLVNIDEYNAKTPREQAKIKRVLTEHDVQTRCMRSGSYLMLPRMASFIATTNEREPLTDATGSRRYLCCGVTGVIDTASPVDHAALYGQAIAELNAGAPWYLSRDEEAALEQHNRQYRQPAAAEELLLAWFEPAPRLKDHLMQATAIQQELRRHVAAADVPNLKQLTMALRHCHFLRGAVNGCHGWYALRRQ